MINGDNFAVPCLEDVATMCEVYAGRLADNPECVATAKQTKWVLMLAAKTIRHSGDRNVRLARILETTEASL